MNTKNISNNIVIIYKENITSSIQLDPIKTSIIDIYLDKSPKPTLAQFPDVTAIMVPEIPMSLIFEKNKAIISDQSIGDLISKDVLKFSQLVKKINEIIKGEILSYGYNFVYEVDNDFSKTIAKIHSQFFKPISKLMLPKGSVFKYAIPKIVFEYKKGKITLGFEPIIDNPQSKEIDRFRVSTNVHFNKKDLPSIEELKNDYINYESYISNYIRQIIS